MSVSAVGRPPTDGKAGFLGSIGVRFMVDGHEADERFSLVEHPMSARALAAPLHRHTNEDEYSFVIEGRMGALLGGEHVEAGPGDLVHKPRGEWHTFWNAGDEPCRILNHFSRRLRTLLRGACRSRRRRAGRSGTTGRLVRAVRIEDGSRKRARTRAALRPSLPGRTTRAAPSERRPSLRGSTVSSAPRRRLQLRHRSL